MKFIFIFYIIIYASLSSAQDITLGQSPYVITIHCHGGWDSTMVFDDKIASNFVDTEPGITTKKGPKNITHLSHSDRPSVDSFFETYGDKSLIINGFASRSMNHTIALQESTGLIMTDDTHHTSWWAFYGSQIGGALKLPHISINAPYEPGRFGGFSTYINSKMISEIKNGYLSSDDKLSEESLKALNSYINSNLPKILEENLVSSIDESKNQDIYYTSSFEQILSSTLKSVTIDENNSQLLNDALIAINLMKSGQTLSAELQAGPDGAWDSQENNFNSQSLLFENLFSDLNKIIAAANDAGIGDQLTIIVKSEFGRAPKLNTNNGKDHWPYTSMLIWGKGVKGGEIVGSTNDYLIATPINLIFGTPTGFGDSILDSRHIYLALLQYYGVPSSLISTDVEPAFVILSEEDQ